MFEFLKKKPFIRWKFVQRMLERSGQPQHPRRRLSAGTDGSSADSIGDLHDGHPRPDDASSLNCSEVLCNNDESNSGSAVGTAPTGKRDGGAGRSADPELAGGATADSGRSARAAVDGGGASARTLASVPFHARSRYAIGCEVNVGPTAATTSGEPSAELESTSSGSRHGRLHRSLREAKSKGGLQVNRFRVSLRKKASTGQADYDVLADESVFHEATSSHEGALRGEPHGVTERGEGAPNEAGDGGTPKPQQALAAVRRSFRKTSKYIRYGTQSLTLTKPSNSFAWAASSSTKQTLI